MSGEGFDDRVAAEVSAYVQQYPNVGCPAPDEEKAQATPTLEAAEEPEPTSRRRGRRGADGYAHRGRSCSRITTQGRHPHRSCVRVRRPGCAVDVSTALISLVDGFNPCSLWVLSLLDRAVAAHRFTQAHSHHRPDLHRSHRRGRHVHRRALHVYECDRFSEMDPGGGFQCWRSSLPRSTSKTTFGTRKDSPLTIGDDRKPEIYKRMRRVMNAGRLVLGTRRCDRSPWCGSLTVDILLHRGISR